MQFCKEEREAHSCDRQVAALPSQPPPVAVRV